jgi:hypothetical protein
MKPMAVLSLVSLCMALSGSGESFAAESFILKGRVTDVKGSAVAGAEVFIYDSTNTRRPADFISGKSDQEGKYSIVLPAGDFRGVARVRQGELYGPLSLGAKHSGEPVPIDNPVDGTAVVDFVVADIRDAAKGKPMTRDDHVKVVGRVLDRDGKPVGSAYVMINRTRNMDGMPDYLSAYTDESGGYTLYIPAGNYFIGVAKQYPPDARLELSRPLAAECSKIDIVTDLVLPLE